ncbi:WD40-repeat-containing domain protein [Cladochytrium replicatum]|nr:WD40-repeat-containing domain protein [Cladochytrium replicatum]
MFSAERSCVYAVKNQARSLAPVCAEEERNRFLIGTYSPKNDNEIHLVEFDEDEFDVTSHVFKHDKEVTSLSPSPTKADLLFTTYSELVDNKIKHAATLWMVGALEVDDSGRLRNMQGTLGPLLNVASDALDGIQRVLWSPTKSSSSVITVGSRAIGVTSIDQGLTTAKVTSKLALPDEEDSKVISSAICNPHTVDQVLATAGTDIYSWDTRSGRAQLTIPRAHRMNIRDIDCNPNRPHHIATAGDDCKVRFWDTRRSDKPIMELSDHSHWIWSIIFNRSHDQLFLTAGSDCIVNLQSIVSISSAPLGGDDEYDDETGYGGSSDGSVDRLYNKPQDGLIATYDEHEYSVYATAWSPADPWTFASLSHDGTMVIRQVPRDHKYKILL